MVSGWGVWGMREAGSRAGVWGAYESRCGHGVLSARQRATTLACGGIDCPTRARLNSRPAPPAERANMQPPPRKVSDHPVEIIIHKVTPNIPCH